MNSTIQSDATDGFGSGSVPILTDEQLLLRYRKEGDRFWFDELVKRYETELYSYLRRYLGDAQMAEDAFQTTFLQVHLKQGQFDKGRKFRPWLYAIGTNQAIDLQRRNRRHRMVSLDRNNTLGGDDVGALIDLMESSDPSPIADLESDERRDWVRDAVASLAHPLRSAITLVYYQGMKYREAAEILGVPVGTVKSRLHAAVLKLNQAWMSTHLNESR